MCGSMSEGNSVILTHDKPCGVHSDSEEAGEESEREERLDTRGGRGCQGADAVESQTEQKRRPPAVPGTSTPPVRNCQC